MSLEKAIEIFKEKNIPSSELVIEIIQNTETLDNLGEVMIKYKTRASPQQWISYYITHIYEKDQNFVKEVLKNKEEFSKRYDLPEEIIDKYLLTGGGEDAKIPILVEIELDRPDLDESKFSKFCKEADQYLFKVLKEYVRKPS